MDAIIGIREIVALAAEVLSLEIAEDVLNISGEPRELWDAAHVNRRIGDAQRANNQHDVATILSCVSSGGIDFEALQCLCRLAGLDYRETQSQLREIRWESLSAESQSLWSWLHFGVELAEDIERMSGESDVAFYARKYEFPEFTGESSTWLVRQGFECVGQHGGASGWKDVDGEAVFVDYFGGVFAKRDA